MESEPHSALSILFEISLAAVHEHNVQALLDKIFEILSRKMGMLRGTFTLRRGEQLIIEASHGMDGGRRKRGRYQLNEGIAGKVAASGVSELVPDISNDKRFPERAKTHGKIAFFCVPLFRSGQVVGTLSIERKANDEESLHGDLKLLEIIGNLTAEAVWMRQQEALEHERLLDENRQLRKALDKENAPGELVGSCRAMQKIFVLIRQVAPSDAAVLIRGSSGTGKELVANAIHMLSPRAEEPFMVLNCAALPENLLESELFGHERGAFTGARSRRIGRAEAADGGTLFLDEISVLPLPVQVKLLRFIQERTFSRVGGNSEIKADVRLLAASSRNLEELMAAGKFREDLYERLNIFPIILPDLQNRRSDIVMLAEHFLNKFNIKHEKNIRRLSTPAVNMLMSYHWPGNVRELENCIERAVLTATDECIRGYDLPASLQTGKDSGTELLPEGQASFNTMVASYERELLIESLKRNNGNMSAAGRELGLSPRVMHYKVNQYGILPASFKQS
ncbi:MAG: sigma 54-interacting transcriptional regulator [Lentisphaerae bacterium]|nr:sigma 54-interacting transcriptional regulator [Lentisphaerota bacterium]